MPTERKVATVAELTEKMSRMQLAVITDYRGMTVAELTGLRAKLRESGAELIVAKNTLLLIAARETGYDAMESLLAGPTAIAFAYDDVTKAAKVLNDAAKATARPLPIRGGMLGKNVFPADGLEQVTKLPSREQALSQVVGLVQSPLSGVVGVLNAAISNVVYVVQARIDQMQPAGDAA
ncbi:MAG: 50S ribosomal protein L10 [Chloroflexaceae bacterium]|jgi:large subunit ribosomal protein L10|nr:50S ribosomal protein L10 [Chloroflexaceae bacterium]